ncbi:hypothetical protein T07_9433 [Trichinella nelsoni]|uniref:Uncharacterized protein n=1 Tax=Trichinella nelsoni TaxID=6336 RepID=A0A0V0RCM6_9BILA|nr:hypothetical protein T07_9433 [Trichinella nelsoni]
MKRASVQHEVIQRSESVGSGRVAALFGFGTGLWCCRRGRSGWTRGGFGAFPAKAGSGGPGHG